jgi:4-hydroxyphenylpyruvate dioxygenase-like putative hemolysin
MPIPKLTFTVTEAQTKAFAQVWDSGGIKIIMDATSIKFATDWANVVLKSFVADMAAQVKKVAEAKIAAQGALNAVATQTVPQPTGPKSSIILTD